MAAIASFVLDCARSGRWMRGLMALQLHQSNTSPVPTYAAEPAIRQASLALARVTAPHSWQVALSLVLPLDAAQHPREVGAVIDAVSRHPRLSVGAYEAAIGALLRGLADVKGDTGEMDVPRIASSNTPALTPLPMSSAPAFSSSLSAQPSIAQTRKALFDSATRWCSWETAARLLGSLASTSAAGVSPPSECVERVRELRTLRHCTLHDVGTFAHWATEAAAQRPPKSDRKQQIASSSPSSLAVVSSLLASTAPRASLGEQLQRLTHSTAIAQRQRHSRYSARDQRELARLAELKRQELLRQAQLQEGHLLTPFLQLPRQPAATPTAATVPVSVSSMCAALRAITRTPALPSTTTSPQAPSSTQLSPQSVLDWAGRQRLTPELALLYARAVGLVAPHMWQQALEQLEYAEVRDAALQAQTELWLTSRGNWRAALQELTKLLSRCAGGAGGPSASHSRSSTPRSSDAERTRQLAWDTLSRTALPHHALYRLMRQESRPWYRLSRNDEKDAHEPVTRLIAQALARGLRLDELQLSAAGKTWAAQGNWAAALALYYRFPLPEFQKYATRSLVIARPALPASDTTSSTRSTAKRGARPKTRKVEQAAPAAATFSVMSALEVLVPASGGIRHDQTSPARPAPPLTVFAASHLVEAAVDGQDALNVFRGCIRRGTRCTPQLLAAVLRHTDVPAQEVRQLLMSYPAAANAGVRRRAKERFNVEVE